jgi:hypothetical protein
MAFRLFSANSLSPFFGKRPFRRVGSKRSQAAAFHFPTKTSDNALLSSVFF